MQRSLGDPLFGSRQGQPRITPSDSPAPQACNRAVYPSRSLATVIATGLIAFGANAATVTFSSSSLLAPTGINQSIDLGLFDTSLGTLTNVALQFSGAGSAVLSLNNSSAQTQEVQATVMSSLFWGSNLAALNSILSAANPLFTLSATTGIQNISSFATVTFGPLTSTQTVNWDAQLDAIFSSFTGAGPGNFTLNCTSLSGLTISGGGGNIGSNLSSQAGCGAEIIYTFNTVVVDPTPVPEPASLALVALALGGLVLTRRKSHKA